ncbi:M23 family metallopeptidase [Elusimicrobiota bacterium]
MEKILTILLKPVLAVLLVFISLRLGNSIAVSSFPAKKITKIKIAEEYINNGESLYVSLKKKFSTLETLEICKSLGKVCDIKKVRAGEKYKIYYSTAGELVRMIYMPNPLLDYVVEREPEGFIAKKVIPDIDKKTAAVKGTISGSLYESMTKAGLDNRTIMNFAEIFQWQIDFFTEVYNGEKFLLIFDRFYRDGKAVKNGSIQTAVYKKRNSVFSAIRFVDGKSKDYYDAEGNSFKKQFLRAPLNYSRISSYFSRNRRHPILKRVRPHHGIDYAAPRGTPVSAIGDGRITYRGWHGGHGRFIRVRHNATYESAYGHLKGYRKGLKKGGYVKQGQVIGYVGSSGISTGPHLHFEIKKNGSLINFLRLKFPAAKAVSKENMAGYKAKVEKMRDYMKYMEDEYFNGKIGTMEEYIERNLSDKISFNDKTNGGKKG